MILKNILNTIDSTQIFQFAKRVVYGEFSTIIFVIFGIVLFALFTSLFISLYLEKKAQKNLDIANRRKNSEEFEIKSIEDLDRAYNKSYIKKRFIDKE